MNAEFTDFFTANPSLLPGMVLTKERATGAVFTRPQDQGRFSVSYLFTIGFFTGRALRQLVDRPTGRKVDKLPLKIFSAFHVQSAVARGEFTWEAIRFPLTERRLLTIQQFVAHVTALRLEGKSIVV